MPVTDAIIDRLCTACGLCCNGVLFTSVVCSTAAEARRMEALGQPLDRSGGLCSFTQPCRQLRDTRCGIYADRPTRCRRFECELLKRVDRGEVSATAAAGCIDSVRLRSEIVRSLLRGLGDEDESRPLATRCDRVMELPVEKDEEWWDTYATFLLEVRALQSLLKAHFYEATVATLAVDKPDTPVA